MTGNDPSFDVFSFNSNSWYKFGTLNLFRHSSWVVYNLKDNKEFDVNLYIYGGFEGDSNSTINSNLYKINIKELFSNYQTLAFELEEYIQRLFEEPTFSSDPNSNPGNKERFQMAHRVVLCNIDQETDLSNVVKSLSVQKLKEENKKINMISTNPSEKDLYDKNMINLFGMLMPPVENFTPADANQPFVYTREQVMHLIEKTQKILKGESTLLLFKSPLKIYGSICGQYNELMRYFYVWGKPAEHKGDIESFRYLFLGNFSGRGLHSLELICLFMMLKIKYSGRFFFLRGMFEDRQAAKEGGLGFECQQKFKEDIDAPDSVFNAICDMFDLLPLAAVVNGKILLVHSVVGDTVKKVSDLEIKKPYSVLENKVAQEVVLASLGSCPQTEGDNPYLKYRQKEVSVNTIKEFLIANNLTTLIRGRDIVEKGFQTIEDNKICTVTSVSNYCGMMKNRGTVCVIKKNKEIQFKSIIEEDETSFWYLTPSTKKNYPPSPRKEPI